MPYDAHVIVKKIEGCVEEAKNIERSAAHEERPFGQVFTNTFLKWSAVGLSLGTIGLHLLGYISHRAYLDAWGIDRGLFGKPVDWLLVQGYEVVFFGFSYLLTLLIQNIGWLVLFGAATLVAAFLSDYKPELSVGNMLRLGLTRLPERVAEFVRMLCAAVFMCALILLAPLLVAALIRMPIQFGEMYGTGLAEQEREAFSQGCSQRKQKTRCVELRHEGRPNIAGFILDSSESYVAIYVVSAHAVQVLKRDAFDLMEGAAANVASP